MARRASTSRALTGGNRKGHHWGLLLIDVINALDFPGGEKLLPRALPMARRLEGLKARAVKAGVPCIYVNDNFGQWRSDFRRLVAHCLEDGVRGEPIARMLAPADADYFVLKPLHSGFYATSLDILLKELGVRKLVLGGIATEGCVLFTASDAYIRGFEIAIPRDGSASESAPRHRHALEIARKMLKADTRPCARVSFR